MQYKLTIEINDVGEDQVAARLLNSHGEQMIETLPQDSPSRALKLVGQLLDQLATDVLHGAENRATISRQHPKVKHILGLK